MENKKVSWSDLTPAEQAQFTQGKGCGPGKLWRIVPQFMFKASCWIHDFSFNRGGAVLDFVKANAWFYVLMLEDIQDGKFSWYKRIFLFKVATLYYIWVSTFGVLFFDFGPYKTKEEILNPKPKWYVRLWRYIAK